MIELVKTEIVDCYLVNCQRYHDNRGFFQEIHSSNHYTIDNWKQTNLSFTKQNGLRGIHCASFNKMITCVKGEIFDVVVDLRENSPTYLKWQSFLLNSKNPQQIIIPAHCGHGFQATEDSMIVYFQDDTYKPNKEHDYHWQSFDIKWPLAEAIVSERDKKAAKYKK